jgi:thiol-disulfide isomerase/thioredoxin
MRSLFIILFSTIIAACGAANSNETQTQSQSESANLLTDIASEEIEALIARHNAEGKVVLVNIWATWCGPCIEEFPDIVELKEKYNDNLEVVFISADFPEDRERALQFLKDQNVTWETYMKTGKDEPFINAISEDWSGALPFTKIYSKSGQITSYWENKASFETFETAILEALNVNL